MCFTTFTLYFWMFIFEKLHDDINIIVLTNTENQLSTVSFILNSKISFQKKLIDF